MLRQGAEFSGSWSLDNVPPGIMDGRSWAYWNLRVGRFPPPPQRTRAFDNAGAVLSAPRISLEERQSAAVETWRKPREQEPQADMEETRRRAAQEWAAKYGSGKKE